MRGSDLWRGSFGDAYAERNPCIARTVQGRYALFREMLAGDATTASAAEIGAGAGANLLALRALLGLSVRLVAVEPNATAREALKKNASLDVEAVDGTAERIPLPDESVDLAFTSGVLIHVPPELLSAAMSEIFRISRRYIGCIEYFNPELEERPYRGRGGALWRADYGSLYLDRFPELVSVRYGFAWKRATGLDNVTWHLLEKR